MQRGWKETVQDAFVASTGLYRDDLHGRFRAFRYRRDKPEPAAARRLDAQLASRRKSTREVWRECFFCSIWVYKHRPPRLTRPPSIAPPWAAVPTGAHHRDGGIHLEAVASHHTRASPMGPRSA